MASGEDVLYRLDGHVATITLNRPDELNALTDDMLVALPELIERAGKEARVLVVTGAGRGFCAGASIPGLADGSRDLGDHVTRYFNPVARAFAGSAVPVISAVNGPAAGAGASIALWGDIVVAARSAYFLFAFVNIGLAPDTGATWLLMRSVGRVRATELLMLGEKLPAERALTDGLVNRVVDDGEVLAAAQEMAERLASQPPVAVRSVRQQLDRLSWSKLERMLLQEAEDQRVAGYTEDFIEGVRAFKEKRAAKFKGR